MVPTGDTSINTVVNERNCEEPRESVRECGRDEWWEGRRGRVSVNLNLAGTMLEVVCGVWMFVSCTCACERGRKRGNMNIEREHSLIAE